MSWIEDQVFRRDGSFKYAFDSAVSWKPRRGDQL